jgi:large subunit ribosomal protein L22
MKATAKQLRITPRKINLIAELVRGTDVNEALAILRFTPKKGAKMLYKIVKSAVANAENNFKQDKDSLYVKEVVVGKAVTLKRSVPISRGRVHPILKRSSHVHVMIGVRDEGKTKSPKAAKAAAGKTETPAKEAKKEAKKATPTKAATPKKTPAKATKVKA